MSWTQCGTEQIKCRTGGRKGSGLERELEEWSAHWRRQEGGDCPEKEKRVGKEQMAGDTDRVRGQTGLRKSSQINKGERAE